MSVAEEERWNGLVASRSSTGDAVCLCIRPAPAHDAKHRPRRGYAALGEGVGSDGDRAARCEIYEFHGAGVCQGTRSVEAYFS